MKEPSRYSARIAAVKTSFLRISATRNELRIVETTARLLLDELHRAARGLDALARGLRELVGVDRELDRQLAAAEDLDRDVALLGQAGRAQRLEIHRRAVGEARGQVVQVHVLHVGPERLERHRHLLVRPAQLAHAHVDGVLAALEARAVLGAGAGAVALVAAPGGLAVPGAVPAPDALAVALGARSRLEAVEADGLGVDGLFLGHGVSSSLRRRRDDGPRGPSRAAAGSPAARPCGRCGAARASAECRAGARSTRWTT